MPHSTRAFFYPYSLGTDLNEWPLRTFLNGKLMGTVFNYVAVK